MNKVKFKLVILVDFLRTTKELSMNSTGLTKVCERIFLVIQCILMKDKKKKWNFKTCKRNIHTYFIIQECIFLGYTLIDEVTDRLTVYLNIVYFLEWR